MTALLLYVCMVVGRHHLDAQHLRRNNYGRVVTFRDCSSEWMVCWNSRIRFNF
jgi:hypothetical protein